VLAPVLASTVLTGCGTADDLTAADGKLHVVATTTQVADFARQVAGDRADVTGILRPGFDPHDYEPSPADLVRLGRADLVVENGIGVEGWLAGAVGSSGFDGPVVVATTGVALRDADGATAEVVGTAQDEAHDAAHDGAHDGAHDLDPHVWQDPRNAERMVATIRDAFVAADPADAVAYRANADRYLGRLAALDREVAREIATIPPANRRVVTDHDAFGYYFARYGLTFVGSVIPSFDTSAELSGRALADLVARIRAERVPAVFAESSLPPRTAETVAAEAGIRVVAGEGSLYGDTLGPAGSPGATYVGMVEHNTATLVTALGGRVS
jgi:zinc/manganese transport system substrate-binding protein/manganese/iron transport system substrate-binding protein